MSNSKQSDPLVPVLREAEADLKRLLRETCVAEADGVVNDSSAEIRRLEDKLLAAAVAADKTITLRRHIRERDAQTESADAADAAAPPPDIARAESKPAETMREFSDEHGRKWRAWSVTPGRARTDNHASRYLGEFHKGWICFETLDSTSRRRLPCEEGTWNDLSDEDLKDLLGQAISAPLRKGSAERGVPKRTEKA